MDAVLRLNDSEEANGSSSLQVFSGGHGTDSMGLVGIVLTSFILGIMTLTTIIGNVFVIAAIFLERNLQNVANYLILSLAVADLMVAVLVMPLGAVYEISMEWTFSPQLCDMWTSSDVLCCTASILHLLAIAVDRYWAVTHVHYIHSRTFRTIGTMILLIWMTSIIISLAPLFGWKDLDFENRVNIKKECIVSQDVGYQIFATMSTFYVPLVLILLLYWRIFVTARNRLRNRMAQKAHIRLAERKDATNREEKQQSLVMVAPSCRSRVKTLLLGYKPDTVQETAFNSQADTNQESPGIGQASSDTKSPIEDIQVNHCRQQRDQACQTEVRKKRLKPKNSLKQKANKPSTSETADSPPLRHGLSKKKHISLEAKRERKAAKTLAIVTGAFIACWLPFFILALVMAIFKEHEFNHTLVSFFLWLGYFNSTLNPIIYTIFSPEFRAAFQRMLCGKTVSNNHRPRHLQ